MKSEIQRVDIFEQYNKTNKNEKVTIIGTDQSEDLIKVAYREIDNAGGEKCWKAFGFNNYSNWCCMFISWCADQCGFIESGLMPLFTISRARHQLIYEQRRMGKMV